ncbi:isochorismatase family protein [Nocardia miyunensis]|uniref:isochorismatase family protein n=1 Tax=Nocardia miyunensis TaxID=282684 RepID=UPI0009FBD4FF|nr:isochorismatase family protein [Nocardia miyunensis]
MTSSKEHGGGSRARAARAVADRAGVAVVCVECQNGVIGPDSVLPALAADARAVVAGISRLVTGARAAGIAVVHATFEGFLGGGSAGQAPLWRALDGSGRWQPGHLATQVVADVFDPADVVLPRHHGLSPTRGTELLPVLRSMGIHTVVLAGVSLNVALPLTAADATQDGFRVVVARDAVMGTPAEYAEQVLRNTIAMLADVVTVDDLTAAWSASAVRA